MLSFAPPLVSSSPANLTVTHGLRAPGLLGGAGELRFSVLPGDGGTPARLETRVAGFESSLLALLELLLPLLLARLLYRATQGWLHGLVMKKFHRRVRRHLEAHAQG
ncbi:hypothetical protein TeGR_g10767 [Tetraparma gracilis]|uniref:Uncharacterized protein n=1 Tax=Tetraparma gracilis TaxID=2962635 RepID=A0ABQ6N854_9STRA|nr:hypothetical protein TeGR_g10767 [Tetraparma gracilis]